MEPDPIKVNLLKSKSHWSMKIKIARAIWRLFQIVLFWRGSPRLLSPLRVLALRLFGAKIGKKVLIMGGVRVWCPWNLSIGDYTAIGSDVEIYNFGLVYIGTQTVVSQYSYICTASHRYQLTNMPLYWESIELGSQVWIAAGAFISPGVKIGEGAVVGAKSVVTRSVSSWTVVAGNPAKHIKNRELRTE